MTIRGLRARIEKKKAVIGVVGLGYVGLPVAAVFAEAGFTVLGVETKTERVETVNSGRSPIGGKEPGLAVLLEKVVADGRLRGTSDYTALADADVALIAVETPIDEDRVPRYEALTSALRSLGTVLKDGALVIVESTIAPGTTERLIGPLLEEATGRKLNEGFFLGHCPERVMPGKLLHNLRHISRVCGGSTPETAEAMVTLYRQVVEADLDAVDCVTAEIVKTAENAYRDVNIAFANELALICEATGGDVWNVRELVNKIPGRNVLLPGAGVGGHCIPKDPWLLAHGAEGSDVPIRLIPAARTVNEDMPRHVADLTVKALEEAGRDVAGAKILIMGYAYREDSDDDRNSPSAILVEILSKLGAGVVIHDPYVTSFQGDLFDQAKGCDAAVVMVKHREYENLDPQDLIRRLNLPVIVDSRNVFGSGKIQKPAVVCKLGVAKY